MLAFVSSIVVLHIISMLVLFTLDSSTTDIMKALSSHTCLLALFHGLVFFSLYALLLSASYLPFTHQLSTSLPPWTLLRFFCVPVNAV